jgi:hypothetical protein
MLFSVSEEVSVTNQSVGSYWIVERENWNHESLHIYDFDPLLCMRWTLHLDGGDRFYLD